MDKIPQKNRSLLVHIVELSTAVVEVDIQCKSYLLKINVYNV